MCWHVKSFGGRVQGRDGCSTSLIKAWNCTKLGEVGRLLYGRQESRDPTLSCSGPWAERYTTISPVETHPRESLAQTTDQLARQSTQPKAGIPVLSFLLTEMLF